MTTLLHEYSALRQSAIRCREFHGNDLRQIEVYPGISCAVLPDAAIHKTCVLADNIDENASELLQIGQV